MKAMGKGINYGNYHDFGIATPIPTTSLDAIKNAGFRNIRIPVKWLGPQCSVSEVTPAYMAVIAESVKRALDRGFFVLINVHHDDCLANFYGPTKLQTLRSLWKMIATRFRASDYRLAFEIYNEPPGAHADQPNFVMTSAQVNEMNLSILSMIRNDVRDTSRVVLFAVGAWNQTQNVADLVMGPTFDPHVGITIHQYHPIAFAFGNAATWERADPRARETLTNEFNAVSNWSRNTGYPVHLGEFGIYHSNPTLSPKNRASVLDFYRTVSQEAIARGWGYAVWDDNGWAGVFHRNDNTWENDIRDALAN